MSTLTVSNIKATGETASRSVSGVAAAWGFIVGWTASGPTIDGSNNLSSVTDNGTGNHTINYTNSMADANYAYHLTTSQLRTTSTGTNHRGYGYPVVSSGSITIQAVYISSTYGAATVSDIGDINLTIHGDLA
jgi:hypothetical protein